MCPGGAGAVLLGLGHGAVVPTLRAVLVQRVILLPAYILLKVVFFTKSFMV